MTQQQIDKEIQSITSQLILKYKPEKIILYGSAARGELTKDSDLDFLVIKDGIDGLRRAERYYQVIKILKSKAAMDILIYTPYEIKKRIYLEDPFIKQILTEGKTLYGAPISSS